MRFGLTGFPLGGLYGTIDDAGPPEIITKLATTAEACGYDFVCGQDHIVAPREWAQSAGTTWFDPFVLLSWAAASTTALRFLTDVVVLPYRSPFHVAKAGATLDALSNGRLILGVAAGYLEREFEILQTEFDRRGAWTDEGIEVIKTAWENEWFSHDGEFFTARDVSVSPRPAQRPRPPIWVGGNSPRAFRRSIEHADGWTPFMGEPDRLRETMRAVLEDAAPADGFAICAPLRHLVDGRGGVNADDAARRIDALAAVGVTHIKVMFQGPTLGEYNGLMERFAETVIARF